MEKTKEIIAYIINFFQQNDITKHLGKVKLVKILWFADREFMAKYYRQLTELEYRKMPYGPMPNNIDSILETMQSEGIIKTFEVSNGYNQTSFICLKEPDLNNFSPQEIHILDSSILNLHKKSAKYLSKKLMMIFGKR